MNFDDILVELGDYGRYQLRVYGLLCLQGILLAFHHMASVFLAATTKFRCAIPGYHGDTYDIQNETHEALVDAYIPKTASGQYDTCRVYRDVGLAFASASTSTYNASDAWNSTNTEKCSAWVYDKSVFENTIFTEFNLVCDRAGETTLSTVLYMSGVLVGSFIFGILADAFGRKSTFLISNFLALAAGVGCTFSPNYYAFVALRFIIGGSIMGSFICNYTLGGELMSPRTRLYAAAFRSLFFSIGYCILALAGYLVRDWRRLQLYISLPGVFFILFYWFVPESPRWLLSKGREDEAEQIIRAAEKYNAVKLPQKLFDDIRDTTEKEPVIGLLQLPGQLVKARRLLVRVLIMLFNWMVLSLVYFGLSLNSGNLGGDIFLNFFLSGLIEFPSKILSLSSQWIGRKTSYVFGMLLGGVACLSSIFVVLYFNSNNIAMVTLSMIGKLGASNGFFLAYFWGAEIFPTVARNGLTGICSALGRVGAIVAAPIGDLSLYFTGDMAVALPQIIFGVVTIVAALMSLYLPETKGRKLPESIEDCEHLGRLDMTVRDEENQSASQKHSSEDDDQETEMETARL